jgi:transcriptional regulator with XRE-family HTH domain
LQHPFLSVAKKHDEVVLIGSNVRLLRESQGISRAQLAFEIGTTEKQLSRIENGEINSGILTYIKIVRVLNISIQDLFDGIKYQ